METPAVQPIVEPRTVKSVIEGLTKMVESKTPISCEAWVDAAGYLEILKFAESETRLTKEILANKKKKEIRATTESNADADLEWKTTEEYKDWRRQEDLMANIKSFGQVAKKEAEIRKY
jgi:hypothetical protein